MAHTKACLECHKHMLPESAVLKPRHAPRLGLAPNYTTALHGVCISCHEERAKDVRVNKPALGQCATCHSGKVPAFDPLRPDDRQAL
jgi:hypothetical protein